MKRSKVITAVIAIIAVVAAACVYGYVRSKPADEPEKPAVTEPENPTTPETPDDSNSGKPSDSKTDEPAVQPENPNPSGTESVTIYVPDEQGETLTPTGADAKDDSDQSLVDALIAAGSLPEGVKVQSSSLENGTLTLDMNAAFGEAIRASGTAGETLKIYALVNTFAQARGATAVLITVDGKGARKRTRGLRLRDRAKQLTCKEKLRNACFGAFLTYLFIIFRNFSLICAAAAHGSSAFMTAETTAMPLMGLSASTSMLSAFRPPMATTESGPRGTHRSARRPA